MLGVFLVLLFARWIISLLIQFARVRPTGPLAVVFEVVYTVTDPVLRPLERALPPIRIGNFAFSLAFLVLIIAVSILMNVATQL